MVYGSPAEQFDLWLVMSQRDGFSGGFLLGTIVGSIVGGVVGALLTARQLSDASESEEGGLKPNTLDANKTEKKKRLFKAAGGYTDIEAARRGLEDKIAQLNEAIDDVRQQLGGVNGGILSETGEQATVKDELSNR